MKGLDRRGDGGTGLLSTSIAVLVFLLFMASSVRLLSAMYATSTVMAISTDSARSVASRSVTSNDDEAVRRAEARAESAARRQLGRLGRRVTFDWTVSAREVRLHVVLVQPWRLGPSWSPTTAFSRVDRVIVIQRELPR